MAEKRCECGQEARWKVGRAEYLCSACFWAGFPKKASSDREVAQCFRHIVDGTPQVRCLNETHERLRSAISDTVRFRGLYDDDPIVRELLKVLRELTR